MAGIYTITNTLNGMQYVGSAVSFKGRWKVHRSHFKLNKHSNVHMQRVYNKYGDVFKYSKIEECDESILIEREQAWIDGLRTVDKGYNMCKVAGSTLGFKHSEETKKKMSIAHKQPKSEAWKESRKSYVYTEETRKKMSLANKGTKPAAHTIEASRAVCSKSVTAYRDNEVIGIFKSMTEASKALSIDRSDIGKVAAGKKRHAKGLTFKINK